MAIKGKEEAKTQEIQKWLIKVDQPSRSISIPTTVRKFMTPIQRRRWRLRLAGRSLREIAKVEGVGHQRIQKSLALGRKRVAVLPAAWGA
jgi:hypothetical protein